MAGLHHVRRGRSWFAVLISMLFGALVWPQNASAYVGDSFIILPGVDGGWRGEGHAGAIRAVSHDWIGLQRGLISGNSNALAGNKLFFAGPGGARPGSSGRLGVALRADHPMAARLLDMCRQQAPIPELIFSESSDRSRPLMELGERPAEFPAFWRYRLRDVVISSCPTAEGSADQGFVLSFADIEWLNYDANRPIANPIEIAARDLPRVQPLRPTSRRAVNAYLITWIAPANSVEDNQCAAMNGPPTEEDYFRYLSPEERARARAANGEQGVSPRSPLAERRGPGGLNVVRLPGVVPDPGLHEPQSPIAEGLDLDGNDGSGEPPRGTRRHRNYRSPDGRTGIDNQLFTVMGCIPGYAGRRGYRFQTSNARRADGNVVTLIEVSGIDDPQNDARIDIAFIYGMDRPVRDNAGQRFIPNYTFRPTRDPNFALYNMRVRGRIVDGVIESDEIPLWRANLGQDPLVRLHNARMRFVPQADGSLRGVIAGYVDWRWLADQSSGYSESLFGYQTPALYEALRRNADGLYDPHSGEYTGISVAYEIDTVPAFIGPAPAQATAQNEAAPGARAQ